METDRSRPQPAAAAAAAFLDSWLQTHPNDADSDDDGEIELDVGDQRHCQGRGVRGVAAGRGPREPPAASRAAGRV